MMKLDKINPQLVLYGAAGLALLFVVYKSTKAVGGAIDTVTGLPGRAINAVTGVADDVAQSVADTWNNVFHSSPDVPAGTTTSPRSKDPDGMTFGEGASGALDPFDMRYYGLQGNQILNAQTNMAGPGGAGFAVGSSGASAAYFSPTNPVGNMTGM